ncbi:related to purine nucleotide binding protein [Rhynchosporium graminicola]|uniref:ribonuclease Z n=1 Tax=Rhynchosporium graminicola TaxID=2792576 RepID=A0A1E1K6D4_9HELO|nr:related to purine nucleotide binding protein [Rhynchosporium commune]
MILRLQPLTRSSPFLTHKGIRSITQYFKESRVFPGPRLRTSKRGGYYIVFEKQKENGVNSVSRIWRPWVKRRKGELDRMKSYVQILSTPTVDTPGTTLLLHFDNKRYLIGDVAEGTQRAAIQRKLGLSKVADVFLTGTIGWGNSGGILGMILTLADVATVTLEEKKKQAELSRLRKGLDRAEEIEKNFLNVHGGKNLTHLLATARRFVFRKGMPLYTNEFRAKKELPTSFAEPTFKDEQIKLWAVVLESETSKTRPRKRSHEEFSEETSPTSINGKEETPEQQEDRYDQMRKSVVSAMFRSGWRLDALVKKKLSEVQRPAAIFFRNAEGEIQKYLGNTLDEDPSVPDIDVLVRNPWPAATIETLPPTTPSETSVCYFIKNHPQRGKFNPKVAKEFGVTPGPDFRLLTSGESVTTSAGNVVTPDMVMAQGSEGGGFAVIELPDVSFVGPLIGRPEWTSNDIMSGIGAVIWILGPGVVEDSRLQAFMREHSGLKHIVSSKDCCANYLSLESPTAAAIRLNLVDAERFPIPQFCNEPPLAPVENQPYVKARIGHTLQLEPKVELQDTNVVAYLDTLTVVKEASSEVQELAKIARKEITSPEFLARLEESQKDIPSKDAEIITLGTGSALPSKYRNVSATLLRVPGYGNYLFDCGENTLGQLYRVFGDEIAEILRDLKVIWISHLHADHHLGTVRVIKAWAKETAGNEQTKNNSLIVASHDGMTKFLKEYSEVEDFGYERVEPVLMEKSRQYLHTFSEEQTKIVGLTTIKACGVDHCHGALAVAFNFTNGFKVAYSGDCRPSERFVEIGKDATLLIHEATFDDELRSDAIAKKHSTTSEALGVGERMNARRILLTHFSQRYQKIPVMKTEGKDQVAIVAFDYMRCRIGDFAKFEALKPALVKLYEDKAE